MIGRGSAILFAVALCGALCGALCTARAQDTIPAGKFVLRGTVRGLDDVPVASAAVSLFRTNRATTTDKRGEFSLTGLLGGLQIIEIRALGFTPRVLTVNLIADTTRTTISLPRNTIVLDSVHVVDTRLAAPTARHADRITAAELSLPDIIGGNAANAFEMLRPQLFRGRPAAGRSSTTEASERGRSYPRDEYLKKTTGRSSCVGVRICDIDGLLSVSVDEGPLGSPDVLTTLPVRSIREMRYLIPVDATARFGVTAGGGPVLVVYMK